MNKSIPDISLLAIEEGWRDAQYDELEKAKLKNLRRTVLEIPGGGGRYRETQSLLTRGSDSGVIFLNLMQKFDRREKLISSQCSLHIEDADHLPICTSVGKMLNRAPQSNSKFSKTNSQFIRWNVVFNNYSASVRCDGMGTLADEDDHEAVEENQQFTGTVISLVVDRTVKQISKRRTSNLQQVR